MEINTCKLLLYENTVYIKNMSLTLLFIYNLMSNPFPFHYEQYTKSINHTN